jgi:hypothetical protein
MGLVPNYQRGGLQSYTLNTQDVVSVDKKELKLTVDVLMDVFPPGS